MGSKKVAILENQKYAACYWNLTQMNNRIKDTGIQREFDPLQYPEKLECADVVMNLTLFLQSDSLRVSPKGVRTKQNWQKDLADLKKNIDVYSNLSPSVDPNFVMELIISVNGFITDKEPIVYLKSIDNTFINNNRIHITVFQRPNVGWQWGALQDIWQKWKNTIVCPFWMTQESDCYFKKENWFDYLKEMYNKSNGKICFISGKERTFRFGNPYDFKGPLNDMTWRDKYNKPLKSITEENLKHVDPLYYFISNDFLIDLDKTFGCFTYALDCNYQIDAIISGEIGFCQKAKVLGYKWLTCKDVVYGWDGDKK